MNGANIPTGRRVNQFFFFPLLAFFIPFIVRAIPEILMAPYVTGFDTMGHYIPTTILWLKSGIDLSSFIATAPLFYSLVVSFVSIGGSVVTVLKVIPPVLHGFLGLSIYGYAKRGLDWSSVKSLGTAVLATIYFVSLRISWDMLRSELALILLFSVLTLLAIKGSFWGTWKRYAVLSLAMSLVVLAHQLVSVIMFGIIGLTIAYDLIKRKRPETIRLIITSLPSLALLFAIFLFSPKIAEYRLIFGFSQNDGWLSLFGFSSYWALLGSVAGFFLFLFLPILILVVIGFKRLGNFQLRAWVLLCIILSLIPLVSPSNLRWLMLLSYPFAFYVAESLSRIKLVKWKRFKITLNRIVMFYLVVMLTVLSFGLILVPPESSMPYFNSAGFNRYYYQIPTSLLQNTVSITDCQDTANALQWLNNNMAKNGTLLSHRAFYGWSLLTLDINQVILYEYDKPEDTAKTITQKGNSTQIYLIWWVNGQGWYGQSTVSSSFKEIYHSGRIAIYSYEQNQ